MSTSSLRTLVVVCVVASIVAGKANAEMAPIQYLLLRGQNQLVTPAVAAPPTSVIIEVHPSYAPAKSKLENLRDAFGGTIPRLVVTSDRGNWVVVSQEKDVLVVGYQHPERRILAPQSYVQITCEDGMAIVLQSSILPGAIVQKDQLTVSPELPAWLPRDLLKSRVDVVRKETVFSPNQRLAYPGGEPIEIDGVSYAKFILQIPNKP